MNDAFKTVHDRQKEEREARWRTIDQLLDDSYTVDQIAADLDIKRDSIARQAARHGRPDLYKKFRTLRAK